MRALKRKDRQKKIYVLVENPLFHKTSRQPYDRTDNLTEYGTLVTLVSRKQPELLPLEQEKTETVTVLGMNNESIPVSLDPKYAEYLEDLRKEGQNVDNFTKKCHQYAIEQSFSDENFSYLLKWWLYNISTDQGGNIAQYLNVIRTMDEDDPWRLERNGYSGYFEPFKNLKESTVC